MHHILSVCDVTGDIDTCNSSALTIEYLSPAHGLGAPCSCASMAFLRPGTWIAWRATSGDRRLQVVCRCISSWCPTLHHGRQACLKSWTGPFGMLSMLLMCAQTSLHDQSAEREPSYANRAGRDVKRVPFMITSSESAFAGLMFACAACPQGSQACRSLGSKDTRTSPRVCVCTLAQTISANQAHVGCSQHHD